MSQENVAALRQVLDVFNRGDRAAFIARCDPGVENIPPREWPESRPVKGPKAVWGFLRVEGTEPWEASQFDATEVIEAPGDNVVAHIEAELRATTSGATVTFSYWQVAKLRDGKLLRLQWFTDRAEALEAAGLEE